MTSEQQLPSDPALELRENLNNHISSEPVTYEGNVFFDFGLLEAAKTHRWNYDVDIVNTSFIQTTGKGSELGLLERLSQKTEDKSFTSRNPLLGHKVISAKPYEPIELDEEPAWFYEDLEFYENLFPPEGREPYEPLQSDEELDRFYKYLESYEAQCPYKPLEPSSYSYKSIGLQTPLANMTASNSKELVPVASIPPNLKLSDMSSGRMPETDPKKQVTRMLPLILNGHQMNACADSGVSYNTININLAHKLKCKIDKTPLSPDFEGFKLPVSGRKILPIGKTTLICQFPDEQNTAKDFEFYIFEHLIDPLIMGRPFLRFTETLSRFCHRLKEVVRPRRLLPIIRYLGTGHERLRCYLDGEVQECVPDTGAEVNLVSASYVKNRGFRIDDSEYSLVQFADGTIQKTHGRTYIKFSIGDSSETASSESFEILQGLEVDVILGEGILWGQDAYIRYSSSFSPSPLADSNFDIGPISYLGKLENKIVCSKEKLSAKLRKRKRSTLSRECEEGHEAQKLKSQDDRDTAELNRQIFETLRISKLTGLARKVAEEEEAWKRQVYEALREGLVTVDVEV